MLEAMLALLRGCFVSLLNVSIDVRVLFQHELYKLFDELLQELEKLAHLVLFIDVIPLGHDLDTVKHPSVGDVYLVRLHHATLLVNKSGLL
jgi:hypothetical protein